MKPQQIIVLVLVLFCTTLQGYSQTIFGTWQIGNNKVGEGLMESYVFKVDNTFEYLTDSDDGLRRVIALGGTYTYTAPNKLTLVVNYTRELVGGTIERNSVTKGNDSWTIEGGVVQKHPLAKPYTHQLAVNFNTGGALAIEDNRFFRVK